MHVAPRASLLLPTGSESAGRGAGDFGVQANLPVSWVVSPALVTHWNAGVTVVSSAADFNLGASAIYRLRRSVNLLVEAVWLDPDGVYLTPVSAGLTISPADSRSSPGSPTPSRSDPRPAPMRSSSI